MTNRNPWSVRRTSLLLLATAFALGAALSPSGCKKKEPPPPEVVEAPPPPPPPPQPTVAELMKLHDIDPRIILAEDEKPGDDGNPERGTQKTLAVLKFFDAMVRGQDERLRPMLAAADQKVLAELVQQGLFAPAAQAVTRVAIGCGVLQTPLGANEAVFALVQTGTRFDAQLWTFEVDDMGNARFDAQPTPPEILRHLSGVKAAPRIRQWADLLKTKLEEAKKPDELVELPSVDWSETIGEDGQPSSSPTGAPRPSAPSSPSDEPGRRPQVPGGIPAPRPPALR